MSTVKEIVKKVNNISNTDLQKAGVNTKDIADITNMNAELEALRQKLAETQTALAKATAPKQAAFSSVKYLFSLLPAKIGKDGLLPELTKEDAEMLRQQVLTKQKELGIEKEFKLISVTTDYRVFAMVLQAIHSTYYLNVRTTPAKPATPEIEEEELVSGAE